MERDTGYFFLVLIPSLPVSQAARGAARVFSFFPSHHLKTRPDIHLAFNEESGYISRVKQKADLIHWTCWLILAIKEVFIT